MRIRDFVVKGQIVNGHTDYWLLIIAQDPRCSGLATDAAAEVGMDRKSTTFKNVCGTLTVRINRSDFDTERAVQIRPRAEVTGIYVNEDAQRGAYGVKVATALYEKAAEIARFDYKMPLVSDVQLSDASQGFWKKQVAKGRAHWDAGVGRYVLNYPPPRTLSGIF